MLILLHLHANFETTAVVVFVCITRASSLRPHSTETCTKKLNKNKKTHTRKKVPVHEALLLTTTWCGSIYRSWQAEQESKKPTAPHNFPQLWRSAETYELRAPQRCMWGRWKQNVFDGGFWKWLPPFDPTDSKCAYLQDMLQRSLSGRARVAKLIYSVWGSWDKETYCHCDTFVFLFQLMRLKSCDRCSINWGAGQRDASKIIRLFFCGSLFISKNMTALTPPTKTTSLFSWHKP